MQKTILILGSLDTKGDEVLFIKKKIESRGHRVLILDTGILNSPRIKPDITREEVALSGGKSLKSVIKSGDKGKCIENMMHGARELVRKLFDEKRFDGIMSIGGAQAAVIGTRVMTTLPVGVPKLMVTTVASGKAQFGPFVGTKDLTIMHSVVDIMGINSVSKVILSNAAGAISGMVEESERIVYSTKPRVALSLLGNTTPCGMKVKELLERHGYEMISFHQNGTGGIAMEELILEGVFDAVLDLTTHEIIDREFGGLHGAISDNRLEEAGKIGIPQVVVPGCIDYLVFGPVNTVPPSFKRRPSVIHNPELTLVRASKKEMERVAKIMAERLNKAKGQVAIVIPLKGLSMHNIKGSAFYDPQADSGMRNILKEKVHDKIKVYEVENHINDVEFAEFVVSILVKLHGGKK